MFIDMTWHGGYITFLICSTQVSVKFILFINVKMPPVVGILTLVGKINTLYQCIMQEKSFSFQYFRF